MPRRRCRAKQEPFVRGVSRPRMVNELIQEYCSEQSGTTSAGMRSQELDNVKRVIEHEGRLYAITRQRAACGRDLDLRH